jgi:hypothetical protein
MGEMDEGIGPNPTVVPSGPAALPAATAETSASPPSPSDCRETSRNSADENPAFSTRTLAGVVETEADNCSELGESELDVCWEAGLLGGAVAEEEFDSPDCEDGF